MNVETGSLFLSERAKAFFAISGKKLTPAAWNAHVHREDFAGYRAAIASVFKSRRSEFEHEYRIRNATGDVSWILDRAVVVRNAAGRVTRLVGAIADITQRKLDEIELRRARDEATEALERQTATAEVLASISGSMADTQPVFDRIVQNVRRLFGTRFAVLQLLRGNMIEMPAVDGEPGFERLRDHYPRPLDETTVGGRAMLSKQAFQIAPVLDNPLAPLATQQFARDFGFNSVMFSPMIHEGNVIGAIGAAHPGARPFDDRQVALIKTFADQAVIAIENARLFNETREALERQTATSEVLRVIGDSVTDTQPVFDIIAERATRLTGAEYGWVFKFDGEWIRVASSFGVNTQGMEAARKAFPMRPSGGSITARVVREGRVVNVADVLAESDSAYTVKHMAEQAGYRGVLGVPMIRDQQTIGVIAVNRAAVGTFAEKEVDLLRTFADQAVIAIENVRLFNETKDALERQTATADVLKVIASSPSDVQPVFNAILRSAGNLCGAEIAAVFRYDGKFVHLGATHNWSDEALKYFSGILPAPPSPALMSGRTILAKSIVKLVDAAADGHYDPNSAATGHWRRMLGVPMMREGEPLGALVVCWREPGETPQRQVDLLQTFADQAVIAIENVRLFKELESRNRDVTDALERQMATAEILRVISSSPTDVQPVFDAIVQSALRLFDGLGVAIVLTEGNLIQLGASGGGMFSIESARKRFPMPLTSQSVSGRSILDCAVFQIADTEAAAVPEYARSNGRALGFRAIASAPMMRENIATGSLVVMRKEPGPFSDKQIGLLQTFADQAVIAIENVRLFNETNEALERQTATAEILKVISSSPTDVQPVFDIIGALAERLCAADVSVVSRFDGDLIQLVALHGVTKEGAELVRRAFPMRPEDETVTARAFRNCAVIHIPDVLADPSYGQKSAARAAAYRGCLGVPMVREGQVIGVIFVARTIMGHFADTQVELLKTFADQAVIAIENVRLFKEIEARNRALTVALEQQTATSEILRVISSAQTDVQPVFEAIVRSAVRLCGADHSIAARFDGELLHPLAFYGFSPEALEIAARSFPMRPTMKNMLGRAALNRAVVNLPDMLADPEYSRDFAIAGGWRSGLAVPMLRDGNLIGAIAVSRIETGPFPDQYLELLKTFADQAVIAIENVRLFNELQSRTKALTRSVGQLTALREVGQAISSTLDIATVLQTIVSRAVQLTGLNGGSIYEFDERGGEFHLRAAENMADELVEVYRRMPIRLGEGIVGSAAATREPVQMADIQDQSYQTRYRELLIRQGYRAILAVPLLRDEQIIGALTVSRNEPGAFAPDVVELLKTFATQSAMAIQNARLFREIEEKGKQLELASQHKSNFLASMSHELRTPLNAILGFNEMIIGEIYGEVPVGMQEPLADIQTSGKHLLRLINNVLDLAKIEAGRMELSPQDYSVQDIVENVRSTLRPLAAEKGLEFLATVPNDLPLAFGDGGRITQCLMNLAGNSLKFTKAGKVEISAETKGDILVYKVSDTGIGIPPDKIDSLFTEFKQTDATIASEYGGTGLGLSISRKFVEMHGGRIWVESELGRGSAFIFEIPLRAKTT